MNRETRKQKRTRLGSQKNQTKQRKNRNGDQTDRQPTTLSSYRQGKSRPRQVHSSSGSALSGSTFTFSVLCNNPIEMEPPRSNRRCGGLYSGVTNTSEVQNRREIQSRARNQHKRGSEPSLVRIQRRTRFGGQMNRKTRKQKRTSDVARSGPVISALGTVGVGSDAGVVVGTTRDTQHR